MKQQPKTVAAGHFKAHCLALLAKVARTRQPLIVTKRGKPVAKVVPAELPAPRGLLGSVKFHGDIVAPILDRARAASPVPGKFLSLCENADQHVSATHEMSSRAVYAWRF